MNSQIPPIFCVSVLSLKQCRHVILTGMLISPGFLLHTDAKTGQAFWLVNYPFLLPVK